MHEDLGSKSLPPPANCDGGLIYSLEIWGSEAFVQVFLIVKWVGGRVDGMECRECSVSEGLACPLSGLLRLNLGICVSADC